MRGPALVLLVLGVLGALYGGYRWGEQVGERNGYIIGVRKGKVEAARKGPPVVLNRDHSLEQLHSTPEWNALGELSESEAGRLVDLINQAPVPCYRQARKGISLASALLAENEACRFVNL